MKVILSRKGFDSRSGGFPSPVFPDNSLVSLPIPATSSPLNYSKILFHGSDLGTLVNSLTAGKIKGENNAHIDPDLDCSAVSGRLKNWLPAFGAGQSARTHLAKNKVTAGDLFLFFGWFRRVEINAMGDYFYSPSAPQIHAIFGWLQIGEILHVGSNGAAALAAKPWLRDHPHVSGKWPPNNTIFIAADKLEIPGCDLGRQLPGGGVFELLSDERVLTHPGQKNRSVWCLPDAFAPGSGSTLSCHHNTNRWHKSNLTGYAKLKTVPQGQEFVLKTNNEESLYEWLKCIFAN